MKILCYVHAYSGHGREAGAETTMADLLESLVARGWEATVLLSESKNPVQPYERNGVKVLQETDWKQLNAEVAKTDVLISHLECSERTAIVARRSRKPIVQLIHNTMWQTTGYLAEGCDLAIYNTQWVADYHNTSKRNPLISLPQKSTEMMGQRIVFKSRNDGDWAHIVLHPQIDPVKYVWGINGPHDCIGMVNFHEMKNPHVFFEMARRFPDLKFLGLKGGYGEQLIEDCPNVEILENTEHIGRDFYSRLRLLLVPSMYESFGRVAVEAAAQGVPTIASPTPGLKEALGCYGVFADPKDIDSWEKAIKDHLNPVVPSVGVGGARALSQHWADQSELETERLNVALTELVNRLG